MKKYKLLYFVSEDEYFITHKINQAVSAFKIFKEIKIICKFSKFQRIIKSSGFKTKNINFNRRSVSFLENIKSFLNYCFIVSNYKPNVVQCFALKPILYAVVANFFLKSDTKIICCVVGMGYLFINKNLFTTIYKSLFFFLLKIFVNNKVFFVFQNHDDLNVFKNKKILKKNIPKIIQGSGVCIKSFKENKKKKIYDLIFHSRILKDKGIYEIIEALKILKKKKIFIKTLVLGNIDNKNRSSISQQELDLWIKENLIIWKPKVQDVVPYLQKSKISILPSYREGLPKGLLEAASCKLPIISTNVPGCKEVCINNFNGFLVPPKDPKSLARSIEKLVFNKNLLYRFGSNSRSLVEQKFSTHIISKKFLNVYYELI
ncbi:MAG: hypothetical protein CL572_06590 [Alphaproteobacteria bacterium]|nr:hypothetical protein [Alphaproteobacteria bacterium]